MKRQNSQAELAAEIMLHSDARSATSNSGLGLIRILASLE